MKYLIQKGDCSVSVLKIQRCLNQLKTAYPSLITLDEDGIYGVQTEEAVKTFQTLTGLDPDGIIHEMTWDKLICKIKTLKKPEEIIIHSHPSLKYGDEGLDVYKAQEYLNRIQPETSVETDGVFGAQTQVKVIHFQNMAGLNPDGRIGILTWDKMIEYL